MLSDVFESAARIEALREGPCGTWLDEFGQALGREGYAPLTARRHLRAAEHFAHWAARTRTPVAGPIEPALVRFTCHLQRPGSCRPFGHTFRLQILCGARLFLTHLQTAGVIDGSTSTPAVPRPPLITAFWQWMQQQRGTCASTLSNYEVHLRPLLGRLGEEPRAWDARGLRDFVLEGSRTCGWASAKKRTTALRMLLRFLIAEGRCPSALSGAIPVVAHRRLSALPRYLPADEVERVIACCDRTSTVGRRDRVIVLLLARLGLRAGDIVQLRLGDIDWHGASIRVSGKSRRETRLPLTHEVGEALSAYVSGRPPTEADVVFVRSRPPFRAFRSHCAVSVIVDRAFARAGIIRPSRGAAHLLRHSAATSMLRQGASLQEVARVLRHQSVTTTEIYAKVDVTTLGRIAQPWPEVASC